MIGVLGMCMCGFKKQRLCPCHQRQVAELSLNAGRQEGIASISGRDHGRYPAADPNLHVRRRGFRVHIHIRVEPYTSPPFMAKFTLLSINPLV
jgi:hypothetical protein